MRPRSCSATSPPCSARTCPTATRSWRYAATLEGDPDLAGQPLLGYLTGSIDVVVRVPVEGRTRYLTVDYKTNWLGDRAAPADGVGLPARPCSTRRWATPTTRSRRCSTPSCSTATCAGGCPATTPHLHLGGVLYLYLRGMCGPATPLVDGRPCGVFSWRAAGRARRRPLRPAGRSRSAMSDLFEPIDATDARLALGATGLLGAFNAAGVLTSADVHVASALGRLGRESDERVLLAVALAVRAVRGGSVCVDLATVADPPRPALARGRRLVARRRGQPPGDGGPGPLGQRPALPRPLPRAGDPGRRRPAVARGHRARPRPRADAGLAGPRRHGHAGGSRRRRPAASVVRRAGRGLPRRGRPVDDGAHRRPGHRQDHRRRRAARRAARPAPAAGCASRWPPRPARPPPGCSRRCTRRPRPSRRPTASASPG